MTAAPQTGTRTMDATTAPHAPTGGWPTAFILGAPKCGTTALAHYLSEHPDICVSLPKEPGWLAPDLPGLSVVRDAAAYLALFRKPQARARIDASIWYFYSEAALERILAVSPDARFVVMLRNPVKMVPSLHRQLVNALDEDVTDFAEAWALSAARAAGQRIPPKCRAPATLVYTRTAAFGAQLARLYARVPAERVLVMFQEELQRDAGAVYRRTLAFLGLPDDGRSDFSPVNEATAFRYGALQRFIKRDFGMLKRLAQPLKAVLGREDLGFRRALDRVNRAEPTRESPALALQTAIADAYREDMRQLAAMLGRDLAAEFGWPV